MLKRANIEVNVVNKRVMYGVYIVIKTSSYQACIPIGSSGTPVAPIATPSCRKKTRQPGIHTP